MALAIGTSSAMAQITLTKNQKPALGAQFDRQLSVTDMDSYGLRTAEAENITWDLSKATLANGTFNTAYNDPINTQFASEFSDALLAKASPLEATRGIYKYYGFENDEYLYMGYVASQITLETRHLSPILFDDPLVYSKFPMTYKDSFTSTSTFRGTLKDLSGGPEDRDSLFGTISHSVKVDGYGTLLMPDNSTQEVLRTYVEVTKFDSLVTENGANVSTRHEHRYEFHSLLFGEPVLIANIDPETGDFTTLSFLNTFSSTRVVGINPTLLPQLKVYPNPTTDVLHIPNGDVAQLDLFTLGSKNVGSMLIGQNGLADVSTLPEGVYIAVLKDASGQHIGRTRFIKMNL